MDNVEVLEIRPCFNDKPLKAFVDIRLGDWIIRDWRVIKQNGKAPRVAPPQVSWRGQKGEIQYKTIVTLPDELRGQIDFAILDRFIKEMEKIDEKSRIQG
jgi:hypothetical protein